MYPMLEHPDIGWCERTGYPSWRQPKRDLDADDYEEDEDLDGYYNEE